MFEDDEGEGMLKNFVTSLMEKFLSVFKTNQPTHKLIRPKNRKSLFPIKILNVRPLMTSRNF